MFKIVLQSISLVTYQSKHIGLAGGSAGKWEPWSLTTQIVILWYLNEAWCILHGWWTLYLSLLNHWNFNMSNGINLHFSCDIKWQPDICWAEYVINTPTTNFCMGILGGSEQVSECIWGAVILLNVMPTVTVNCKHISQASGCGIYIVVLSLPQLAWAWNYLSYWRREGNLTQIILYSSQDETC